MIKNQFSRQVKKLTSYDNLIIYQRYSKNPNSWQVRRLNRESVSEPSNGLLAKWHLQQTKLFASQIKDTEQSAIWMFLLFGSPLYSGSWNTEHFNLA